MKRAKLMLMFYPTMKAAKHNISEKFSPVRHKQRRAIIVLVRVEENPVCDLLGLDFVHCLVAIQTAADLCTDKNMPR